MGTLTPRGGC